MPSPPKAAVGSAAAACRLLVVAPVQPAAPPRTRARCPASSPPLTLSTLLVSRLLLIGRSSSLSQLLVRFLSRATAASRAESTASHRLSTSTLRDLPTIGPLRRNPTSNPDSAPWADLPSHRIEPLPSLLSPTSSLRPAFLRLWTSLAVPPTSKPPPPTSRRGSQKSLRLCPASSPFANTTRLPCSDARRLPPRHSWRCPPPSPRLASPSAPHPDCVALLPHCGYGVGWTASGLRYSYP